MHYKCLMKKKAGISKEMMSDSRLPEASNYSVGKPMNVYFY